MTLSARTRHVMQQSCTDPAAVMEIANILDGLLAQAPGGGSLPQPLAPADSPAFAAVSLGPGGVAIGGVQVLHPQQPDITDLVPVIGAGSLPPIDGTVSFANTATPTVQELLKACLELYFKQKQIIDTLRAHGLIS